MAGVIHPEADLPPPLRGSAPSGRALWAGIVAGIAYGMIGWRSMLVPALIRSIQQDYGQTDAGLGTYFLATALGYAAGALMGGTLVRSLGSRVTLGVAAFAMSLALMVQGLAPPWLVFLPAGVVAGIAGSISDVGINTLYLDLFPRSRGRALNLLHLTWSVGAFIAPVVVALAITLGLPWSWVMLGSGVAWMGVCIALVATVPSDARHHAHGGREDHAGTAGPASDPDGRRRGLPLSLIVMGVAIGCYVASEAAVSDWLVRVLEDLPLAVASLALTLFWGGLATGRAVFAKIGNRVEPLRAASAMVSVASVLLLAALLVPFPLLSLALFGAVGVAFGPVFPLIVAAAGSRMPGRTATVSTVLTFAAVLGAVSFPPAVGFLSEAIGLRTAMLGTSVLALTSAVALLAARRLSADQGPDSQIGGPGSGQPDRRTRVRTARSADQGPDSQIGGSQIGALQQLAVPLGLVGGTTSDVVRAVSWGAFPATPAAVTLTDARHRSARHRQPPPRPA